MKITILTENRTAKRGFLAEHGLSVFIEHNGKKILFDTGQSDVYLHNAKLLGIDLSKTDCIVLSHGHYDHCGGFVNFPTEKNYPVTYIRKNAFLKKFNSNKNEYREIGIPWEYKNYADCISLTDNTAKIDENTYLCSNIPVTLPFEKPLQNLLVQKDEEKIVDTMSDEQMLVFDTENGLSIFIGCSHPGIASCLNYIRQLFPNKKIYTVLAGMHLHSVSNERFAKTIHFLKSLDINMIFPLHCTGVIRECEMKQAFGNKCMIYGAGDSFEV